MWSALAFQDIRLRYRGSMLGPFWLTISTLVMVVAMGVIYAQLFNQGQYLSPLPDRRLDCLATVEQDDHRGLRDFSAGGQYNPAGADPVSIHAYRNVCRNFIVLAHNLVIVPFGLAIFSIPIGWSVLAIIPGLLLLAINGVWISILLSMISTRFRDVPPIVASFCKCCFF